MDTTVRLDETISPQVLRILRREIVDMTLRPGSALSEKEVAVRFGISRQPVREAFIKLSEAGLVRVLPNRGTYVMKISVRDVANARFVREAIESAIARAACRIASPADVARLEAIIVEQKAAAAQDDNRRFLAADEDFHRTLAEIADCASGWRIVEEMRTQMDRVRFLSLPDASPIPLLIEQHEAVLDAIRRRAVDAAEEAMRTHLREILIALPMLAERNPDLFETDALPAHTADMMRAPSLARAAAGT